MSSSPAQRELNPKKRLSADKQLFTDVSNLEHPRKRQCNTQAQNLITKQCQRKASRGDPSLVTPARLENLSSEARQDLVETDNLKDLKSIKKSRPYIFCDGGILLDEYMKKIQHLKCKRQLLCQYL